MIIDCPHKWKNNLKLKNITIQDSRVRVCFGICDSADRCGVQDCEYYDVSEAGTRIFMAGLVHESTLEGLKTRLKR